VPAAVFLAAASHLPLPAFADGCYFSRESVAASSDQRVLMIRNGDKTSLTLPTAYTDEAEDFAWVIPTPVPLSADGLRPVETGEPGTRVLSYDPVTGLWVTTAVLERQSRQHEEDVVAIRLETAVVRETGNHPFLVLQGADLARRPAPQDVPRGEQDALPRRRWLAARDLGPGDMLADRSGRGTHVTGVSAVREELPVHNLAVAGAHTCAGDHRALRGGRSRRPEAPAGRRSSNLRTRPIRYDRPELQASRDPAAYTRERISRTVGKKGRALAIMVAATLGGKSLPSVVLVLPGALVVLLRRLRLGSCATPGGVPGFSPVSRSPSP
jgi:hypothetical protein